MIYSLKKNNPNCDERIYRIKEIFNYDNSWSFINIINKVIRDLSYLCILSLSTDRAHPRHKEGRMGGEGGGERGGGGNRTGGT